MRPLISYHRGGGESFPANTRQAYEAAIEQGAELIELDVWRSADGVFFCTHDRLDADGNTLTDLTWREIEEGNPDTATYRELLELAAGKTICHIDLKQIGDEEDIVSVAVEVLGEHVDGAALFTTLEDVSVRAIRLRSPTLTVALSLGRDMDGEPRWRTVRTRASEVVPFFRIVRSRANAVAVNHRLVTRPLLWFCRLTRRTVMVWTVNDDARLRRFLATPGVSVVITDRPLRAAALRDEISAG